LEKLGKRLGGRLYSATVGSCRFAPHLTWKLVDWTSRDDVVAIEWESSNRYGERVIVGGASTR
jgi:hypothetical protein